MSRDALSSIQARKALDRLKPYTPGKPIWEVQRELGITEVVKLASNENPLGPSPKALEAVMAALPGLHRYPDAHALELREALAAHHKLAPGQLLVANGTDELITLLSETFLEPDDEVIVPSPSFTEYEFGAHLLGASVVRVALGGPEYRFDPEELLAAVTERTKIVYLCSPHNPTGIYLPEDRLRYLLGRLPERVLVVIDAAYSHYASADDYTDGLAFVRSGYPVVVLQTFSKIYGLAGIRVGYGAAPERLIGSLLKVKEPFNVNALAQAAAAAALADEEHVRRSRELVLSERTRLCDAFGRMNLRYTASMGNFVLVRPDSEADLVCRRLLERGIVVRSGRTWGIPDGIRITVGTPGENDRLLEALAGLIR